MAEPVVQSTRMGPSALRMAYARVESHESKPPGAANCIGQLNRLAPMGDPLATPTLKKARAASGHCWAVAKTMQTDTPGAVKLSRKYGETLVCVRYRLSPDGKERLTTVELEIERVPIQKKVNPVVAVKIYLSEKKLIARAKAKGARFNGKTRLWRMHRNDALALELADRIALPKNQT